ncbi:MAG: HAMP domain-containing histidine kinase [Candidatus Omnitrophica bacterium]|nr:HAMP domain-containing histidine kinase [Candidatus Omnitrophota bacterium]
MTARLFLIVTAILMSCFSLVVTVVPRWRMLQVAILLVAVWYLIAKEGHARRQALEAQRFKNAYDELDKQAKLIVKTDLELSRTQAELDKRITGLYTLHELGHLLQQTTDVAGLFARFDAVMLERLGFEKGCLGLLQADGAACEWKLAVHCPRETLERCAALLQQPALRKYLLNLKQPLLLTTQQRPPEVPPEFLKQLGLTSGVVARMSLPTQTAVLILGNETVFRTATTGDVELVAILVNQLRVAIENTTLNEELWDARRALELKVQERTRELAQANEALQRLSKAKSDFVSSVAHELRTPLTSIKGYASILMSGQLGKISADQAERLTKIDKHSNTLTQLINDLLDLSRLEAGKVTMTRQPIEVKTLFRNLLDVVKPQLEDKRLSLATDADDVTTLHADPAQLERVFINLLSNAIRYTPAGGRIALALRREGDHIVARVSDTGIGIGAQDLPRIFDEFYRANTAMNAEIRGTGLGLSLVMRIVDAHGGRIWVESTVGKGATFFLTLPLTAPSAADPQGAAHG